MIAAALRRLSVSRSLASIVTAICLLTSSVVQGAEIIQKIRLNGEVSKSQWRLLDSLGATPDNCGGGDIYVTTDELSILQSQAIPLAILDSDVTRTHQQRSAGTTTMGGYRTLAEIGSFLDSLATLYPDIISVKDSIGATIEGRPIWLVKISDNHAIDEDEPEVFYNSLIHAREPAAGMALQRFMEYLCQNYGSDQAVTDVVDNRELYFMPVVNPDGYYYNELTNEFGGGLWRKNRRPNSGGSFGVDLNRNFGYGWGEDIVGSSPTQSSDVYRGTAPFSEPETQVLRNLVISRNFKIVNNVHSYSNLFLWPWGGSSRLYTPYDEFYSIAGDSATSQNFYSATVGWLLYPTNGAADEWLWGDTASRSSVISFTTEIGNNADGFWPVPSRIPILAEENIAPNLFLARIADNPFKLGPPTAPRVTAVDTAGDDVTISWQHTDSANTPLNFDVRELRGRQQFTDGVETVNTHWSVARMTRSTTRAHTGTFSWKTQNANASYHWLTSATPYYVTAGDSLSFWIWYNLESDYDYFYAGVATDGYSFVSLSNNLTTNVNPNQVNLGNGITGNSGGVWRRCSYSLAAYAGEYVYFRLAMITDNGTLGEGVYIDDLENIDTYQSDVIAGSTISDSSLFLPDQAAGEVWYAVRTRDTENQISRWSVFSSATIFSTILLGDLDGSQTVDLIDLTILVGYLFLGNPVTLSLANADLDCAAGVDLVDLTILVDHLFINFTPLDCTP